MSRDALMPNTDALTFTLATEDFDVSLLPPEARDRGIPAFREAVRSYLQGEFDRFGGWNRVQVDARTIEVTWTPDRTPPDPLEQIIGKLQRKDYGGAITLLQLFLSDRPNDVNVLYNLGMALSDVGKLAEAAEHLQRAIDLAPDHLNARVALGVALQRQGQTTRAIEVLRAAVQRTPDNVWAQRNLGACFLAAGQIEDAEACFRKATLVSPADQQSWFGLAQAFERSGKTTDADAAYHKAIDVDEYSQIAELARKALSNLAHSGFRDRIAGMERPDAVMYCLGAIERFEKLPAPEVQRITFEIATVGRNGLDVNDSAQKYHLKTVDGSFSGLHLVCLMYVGFKTFAPEQGRRLRSLEGVRDCPGLARTEAAPAMSATTCAAIDSGGGAPARRHPAHCYQEQSHTTKLYGRALPPGQAGRDPAGFNIGRRCCAARVPRNDEFVESSSVRAYHRHSRRRRQRCWCRYERVPARDATDGPHGSQQLRDADPWPVRGGW